MKNKLSTIILYINSIIVFGLGEFIALEGVSYESIDIVTIIVGCVITIPGIIGIFKSIKTGTIIVLDDSAEYNKRIGAEAKWHRIDYTNNNTYNDTTPDNGAPVAVAFRYHDHDTIYIETAKFFLEGRDKVYDGPGIVLAWMELPEPPKFD